MMINMNSHIFGILSPDTRPIVAGSFAGLSMMFLPKGSRVAIMLFFLVRAIELLACHLVERGIIDIATIISHSAS
jgi:hypothetical protein